MLVEKAYAESAGYCCRIRQCFSPLKHFAFETSNGWIVLCRKWLISIFWSPTITNLNSWWFKASTVYSLVGLGTKYGTSLFNTRTSLNVTTFSIVRLKFRAAFFLRINFPCQINMYASIANKEVSSCFFFRFTWKLLNLSQKYNRVTIAIALSIFFYITFTPSSSIAFMAWLEKFNNIFGVSLTSMQADITSITQYSVDR